MNYDELEKINELKEKGILSEEEFQIEKEKILKNQKEKTSTENINSEYTPVERKSKLAAGLLGILLGYFGIHNFYLGYTNKGIAQLLISVLSCGFLSFISGIWGLIDGVMILTGEINTDANGIALKE